MFTVMMFETLSTIVNLFCGIFSGEVATSLSMRSLSLDDVPAFGLSNPVFLDHFVVIRGTSSMKTHSVH